MINEPNNIRNRLCKNKSINISEMLRNRIVFQKAHENNKKLKWSNEEIAVLSKSINRIEDVSKYSYLFKRR